MKAVCKKYKIAIGLSTAILIFLTGISYSGWSETLNIRGILTTANFSIEFGDEEDIEVYLIKADDEIITDEKQVEVFDADKINNKNITLDLKDDLINRLKTPGYMLRISYPLKTSDDSKIKAIKPIMADFGNPDDTIYVTPDSIGINMDGEYLDIDEEVDKEDYEIRFKIYRQIEAEEGAYNAVIFLEADGFNESRHEIIYEYSKLREILPEYVVSYENPVIKAQLEADYSLEVSIGAEQYNNYE